MSYPMIDCPECDGNGHNNGCCDVGACEPGWPDTDLCAGCYEHSVDACEVCNGSGEIREGA